MTLEEIKNILNDENKKFSLIAASSLEELVAEVELLHKDGMTIYGMMEDGRAKAVATRCAEIANEHSSIEGIAEKIEAAIKKEFNL